jgi:hypothetical protein
MNTSLSSFAVRGEVVIETVDKSESRAIVHAAQQDFTLPLPGGVGSRNVLRGNEYADWDPADSPSAWMVASAARSADVADAVPEQFRSVYEPVDAAARDAICAAV